MPFIQAIGGTPTVRTVSAPVPDAGSTTAALNGNVDQNIAPGTGSDLVFPPISQFDKSQYSDDTLPAFAPNAGETTIATMVARALANTLGAPKIDRLWQDGSARWASIDGVRLTDGNGTTRSPTDANGFAFANAKVDIDVLLADGPVMLAGNSPADPQLPTPWLLAVKMTADGKGIVANDPGTGLQVILAYDPATKTIGGVTSVLDPKTQQPVALGALPPDLGATDIQVPAQAWAELQAYKPASYVAVRITR